MRELSFVFDLAGVLVRWDPSTVYEPMFRRTGRNMTDFFHDVLNDQVQRDISAGRPMLEVLSGVEAAHPDWHDEIRAWWERWDDMLVGEIDGSVSILRWLHAEGYRIFALGNWSREEFVRALPRFGFLSLFNDVLLSGDCAILKPDPRVFELAEERFGLRPETTVFIDDRDTNVQAAMKRGWQGIVFDSPAHLRSTLSRLIG